jgi:hypothetical protein
MRQSIFSMLSGLFSRWVFIHFVLGRERLVIGMPSPTIKNKKYIINKIPRYVIVWRAPVDSVSHDLCLTWWLGRKIYYSIWEPPIMFLAWKILRTFVVRLIGKAHTTQKYIHLYFQL